MRIDKLFNIRLPIIQAPMAGVQDSALAAAVSNAGGLGSLPCAMLSAAALRTEIQALRARTEHPFNLNFFCHQLSAPDSAIISAWQALFADFYREWDIDPDQPATGPSRLPFNQEMADVVSEYRPAVVSFHFGLPAPALMDQVRSSGAKILSSATTVEEALWLEHHGVDAIIAQGLEAGGHRATFLASSLVNDLTIQAGTFALLPRLVSAVRVPVIAAGGIADADGVRAAFELGAAGVQAGTAYLLCPEATTSAVHRAAIMRATAGGTALTNLFSGHPARGIVNRLMQALGPMNPLTPPFPLAAAASAPLRAKAEQLGIGDFSPLWVGENVTKCREVSAALLTRQLAGKRSIPE